MNKKVVITGATGLIGKKIVNRLVERRDEVTVFTRSVDKAKVWVSNAAYYVNWNIA